MIVYTVITITIVSTLCRGNQISRAIQGLIIINLTVTWHVHIIHSISISTFSHFPWLQQPFIFTVHTTKIFHPICLNFFLGSNCIYCYYEILECYANKIIWMVQSSIKSIHTNIVKLPTLWRWRTGPLVTKLYQGYHVYSEPLVTLSQ